MAYDNIRLEKGLYTTGKSFTDSLEKLDPSENYKGTELEGLDAFERQLKRFDIKVSGRNSDTISKFFSTTDSAALFPEYVARAVRQGIDGNDKVESIIATTTSVDSFDYRSIEANQTPKDYALDKVAEGGSITEMQIKSKDKLTKLQKYGKMITASYEAIKFQKLDLFALTLKRIGECISINQFTSALEVITDDELKVISTNKTELTYTDLVDLWVSLNPYTMTTLIMNKTNFANILKMPEFRDANAGLDFHANGKIITPFGAEIICCDEMEDTDIIALDKNYAIEKVEAGGVVTEFDKLIDCQLERATISTIVGFSPIFREASCALQINND